VSLAKQIKSKASGKKSGQVNKFVRSHRPSSSVKARSPGLNKRFPCRYKAAIPKALFRSRAENGVQSNCSIQILAHGKMFVFGVASPKCKFWFDYWKKEIK